MDLNENQIRALPHDELLSQFFQMKEEFCDYQSSSKEIEQMLDDEVEELKNNLTRVETRLAQTTQELEKSRRRHEEARLQSSDVEEQLRRSNAELKQLCDAQKEKIRRLEQKNDKLEMSERNKEFTSNELEKKLDNAFETIAMLESQIYEWRLAAEDAKLREDLRSERPRLVVEPLREDKHERMDECSSEPSKDPGDIDDVTMEDLSGCMENTNLAVDDTYMSLNDQENKSQTFGECAKDPSKSLGNYVNTILKDVIVKVERLEKILVNYRVSKNTTVTKVV